VVLDLGLGLRTTYIAGEHHQLGSGVVPDMALGDDRALYVWRTAGPTIKFDGGPTPWDGRGDRLSFGEIAQPGQLVDASEVQRFVLPVPASDSFWVWETDGDVDSGWLVHTTAEAAARSEVLITIESDYVPFAAARDGSLVIATDSNTAQIRPDGQMIDLGTGTPVVLAGQEVLIEECLGDICVRRWVDLVAGQTRDGGSDDMSWTGANTPTVPSHSARIAAASPNNEQILVIVTPATFVGDFAPRVLLRVDVRTMDYEAVSLPDNIRPSLAAWSRDGRSIVVISDNDVIVIDLETGRGTDYPGLIPSGFFVLAAA